MKQIIVADDIDRDSIALG